MKGRDIEAEIEVKSQEEIAKQTILNIKEEVKSREEKLDEAKKKLAEVLEKDIQDIKPKDGNWYEWD